MEGEDRVREDPGRKIRTIAHFTVPRYDVDCEVVG